MANWKRIDKSLQHRLSGMARFGQSKHEAKQEARAAYLKEHGTLTGWNPSKVDGIYTDRDGKQIVAEDKNQSYRRFPFIIPLHEEDFNLLVNKGFFYGTGQFTEWEEYNHIRGNLKTIRQKLQGNERLIRILESKVMELPKSKYDEVLNQLENTPLNDDELQKALEDFKDFGTIQIVKTETCGDCDDELPF